MLLNTDNGTPVLEQIFCSDDIPLDVTFRSGIVKVDEDGHIFGELCEDFVHGVEFGHGEGSGSFEEGRCGGGCECVGGGDECCEESD